MHCGGAVGRKRCRQSRVVATRVGSRTGSRLAHASGPPRARDRLLELRPYSVNEQSLRARLFVERPPRMLRGGVVLEQRMPRVCELLSKNVNFLPPRALARQHPSLQRVQAIKDIPSHLLSKVAPLTPSLLLARCLPARTTSWSESRYTNRGCPRPRAAGPTSASVGSSSRWRIRAGVTFKAFAASATRSVGRGWLSSIPKSSPPRTGCNERASCKRVLLPTWSKEEATIAHQANPTDVIPYRGGCRATVRVFRSRQEGQQAVPMPSETDHSAPTTSAVADDWTLGRTAAQKQMVRTMTKRGAKGFRRLKSAETSLTPYKPGKAKPPAQGSRIQTS